MRKHKPDKVLRSLIRERQRIWQMYFDNAGQIRITIEAGTMKTVLREDVTFLHNIVDSYLAALDKRIYALAIQNLLQ